MIYQIFRYKDVAYFFYVLYTLPILVSTPVFISNRFSMHGYPTKPGASWYFLSFHRRKAIEGCDPVLPVTWLMMVCLNNDQHLLLHRGHSKI